jgi:hypothetical protein
MGPRAYGSARKLLAVFRRKEPTPLALTTYYKLLLTSTILNIDPSSPFLNLKL